MYFGANNGVVVCSYSVIALNHVHDTTAGTQGDGIEIKQGSHHNWVAENHVHDTRYPCILAYGTFGDGENVIERNLLYNCMETGLQVQGDAYVRNNLVINALTGYSSHSHQGPVRNLHVINNTFIAIGNAAQMRDWGGASNMVFANNVCYSQTDRAIWFSTGSNGVDIGGNVAYGVIQGFSHGYSLGTGLADFVDVTWDATARNVTPVVGGAIDNRGVAAHGMAIDLNGVRRSLPVDPGAAASGISLGAATTTINTATGGSQAVVFVAGPQQAGGLYVLLTSLTLQPTLRYGHYELPLADDAMLQFSFDNANGPVFSNTIGLLDSNGSAVASINIPALPWLAGLPMQHAGLIVQGAEVTHIHQCGPADAAVGARQSLCGGRAAVAAPGRKAAAGGASAPPLASRRAQDLARRARTFARLPCRAESTRYPHCPQCVESQACSPEPSHG